MYRKSPHTGQYYQLRNDYTRQCLLLICGNIHSNQEPFFIKIDILGRLSILSIFYRGKQSRKQLEVKSRMPIHLNKWCFLVAGTMLLYNSIQFIYINCSNSNGAYAPGQSNLDPTVPGSMCINNGWDIYQESMKTDGPLGLQF